MAETEGDFSNYLFDELADWEHQLKALEDDIPGIVGPELGGPEL